MEMEKMGRFIQELRKSHQMTQRELAEKLSVSDKAVSKWERGLSCPDISLLSPLADTLGVTTSELLNGARADAEAINVEAVVAGALEFGVKTAKRKIALNLSIIAATFSVLLLIGIFVVSVVDIALSGTFTWSLIVMCACVYAWLVFCPAIRFGAKGIALSLAAFSVFIAPFLLVLDITIDRFTGSDMMVFPMGIRIVPLSIAYILLAYLLFRKLKTRKLLVTGILVLLSSPFSYATNAIVSSVLDQPYQGLEVVLNTFSPILAAAIIFAVDFGIRSKKRDPLP